MLLTVLGFTMVITIVLSLVKKWLNPTVAFAVIPPIFALIAGVSIADMGEFIKDGIDGVFSTSLVTMTAVMYFSLVSEAGLFKPIADFFVKRSKGSGSGKVIPIIICASLLCMVSTLDGDTTSTLLITIPTMLPIFTAAGLDPKLLYVIIGQHLGTFNHLPWGGQIILSGALSEQSSVDIFLQIWPAVVFATIVNIVVACVLGMHSAKKGVYSQKENVEVLDSGLKLRENKDGEFVVDKKYFANLILTVGIFAMIFLNVLPQYYLFLCGFCLLLVINYGFKIKKWNESIEYYGSGALKMSIVIISAGVFIGVLKGAGFADAMTNSLVALLSPSLYKGYGLIYSALTFLGMQFMTANALISAIQPIGMSIAEQIGYSPSAIAAITPCMVDTAKFISPLNNKVYMTSGMLGEDYMECIKMAIIPLCFNALAHIVAAIAIGVLPL